MSPPRSDSAGTHIALLRGINVGGKHRLPMKDLAEIFREAGCAEVRTYIQSGNVVFRAEDGVAERIPALVAEAIAERFGFAAPVVTRTAAELEDVAGSNPFLEDGADPKTLHVVFLADRPSEEQIAELDPDRSPPDEFAVRGREIYLHCPDGVARSKLTAPYFDATLGDHRHGAQLEDGGQAAGAGPRWVRTFDTRHAEPLRLPSSPASHYAADNDDVETG